MITAKITTRRAAPPVRYPVALERAARGRGLMPPLQAHPEATTYSVLDGVVTFFVGDEVVHAETGAVVVAEAGVAHTFRIDSDGARWRVATEVSSIARFDDLGRALAKPGTMTGEDAATLAALAGANAIRVLGAPGSLPPAAA
jgi:cupin domain